jgi:hypothetical protein
MRKAITGFPWPVETSAAADEGAANSRRGFLRLVLLAIGGATTLPCRSFAADGEKMSKQQADYQDSPKDIQMCATCTLFVAPHSCKVVEGDVSPNGWCRAYAMAD